MKTDHNNPSVFTEATDPAQAPQTNKTPEPPNPSAPSDPSARTRRKSFLPPEFEKLTEEQIDGINDLLRAKTYHEAQEQIQFHTGIYISINKLFRYYQKLELAEALALAEDTSQGIQDLARLYAGDPVDLDKAGLECVKRRALQLASSPSAKPSLLLQLLRVFTWEHRASMNEHRKQMDLAKAAHRDRLARLAERRVELAERTAAAAERRAQFQFDINAREMIKQAILEQNGGDLTAFVSEDVQNFLRANLPKTHHSAQPETAVPNQDENKIHCD